MHGDATLAGLMALDDGALTDLLAPEIEAAQVAARDAETRFAAYLDDLVAVLDLEGGAGVRVLRHWLDAAGAGQRLGRAGPALRAVAALHDYGCDRMAEVALASPASLLRIQLEGARQWARDELHCERTTGRNERG